MTATLGLVAEPEAVGLVVDIVVRGVPATQGSHKAIISRTTGRAIVIPDNPKSLLAWRRRIADAAESAMAGRPLIRGAVRVQARYVFSRPQSHFGRRGLLPSAPVHMTTKPDVGKLQRAAEDALKGVVWQDDSLVVDSHIAKSYGEQPGLIMRVTAL